VKFKNVSVALIMFFLYLNIKAKIEITD